MGERKTMRTLLLLFAALAIAAASPKTSIPETEMTAAELSAAEDGAWTISSEKAEMVQDPEIMLQETFDEASSKLDMLIQVSKRSDSQCVNNAKKGINAVLHEVRNAQKILDRMPNGKNCINAGAGGVKTARRNLANKKKAETRARNAYSKARNARVSVTVTYSSAQRNCNVFTNSYPFRRARRNTINKRNAYTQARTRVADARKYLAKMIEKQKRDRCKCKFRVQKAAARAVAQARRLTGERKRTIIRETMLICLVHARSRKTRAQKNAAGQACKRTRLPSKYNNQLTLRKTKLLRMNFFYCHKERTAKERAVKEKQQKERSKKERARKEHSSKERTRKERAQKERVTKERNSKTRERQMKVPLTPGNQFAMRGGNWGRWCSDNGNTIRCNRNWVRSWERFRVIKNYGNRIGIRGGYWNRYCSDNGGGVMCNRNSIGSWERFQWVKDTTSVSVVNFMGGRSRRWCSDEVNRIICNRQHTAGWERFYLSVQSYRL